MTGHAGDDGVYIRSMATRGHLGGLARTTSDAALVLDAAGKDAVIIETVGVGQDEVDIVRTADVSIVVMVPGTGDDVQAIKAGIMEIADIFVVNKADREGADRTAQAIAGSLSLHSFAAGEWKPPIVKTVAHRGEGVAELWRQVVRFREDSAERRALRRRARQRVRLRELLSRRLVQRVEAAMPAGEIERLAERVAARELDPYTAVEQMIRGIGADL
jgi:LAO/AO transport system kinase